MTEAEKAVNKAIKAMNSAGISPEVVITLTTIYKHPKAGREVLQEKLGLTSNAFNNRLVRLCSGSKGRPGHGLMTEATGRNHSKGNSLGLMLTPKGKSLLKQLSAA